MRMTNALITFLILNTRILLEYCLVNFLSMNSHPLKKQERNYSSRFKANLDKFTTKNMEPTKQF